LLALPDTSEQKENTLRLIANWRIITIKQTNLIEEDQEIVMNLSTAYVEWEQKTLEQGRQEGEQQGIQQGEKRLIIRQINKRFDVIPDALVEQIHQLSIEQLELLSEAFLDFSTITDLEQWLENRT
jgi:flagellar biosynthesis/type III secretory pathway protein FliH